MSNLSPADRMLIEHECARLSIDYSQYADSGRMDEWAQLFADDAEMHLFGQVHKGRTAIRNSLNPPPGTPVQDNATVHAVSNIRVEVLSPTEAKGSAYVTVFAAPKQNGVGAAKELTPMIVGMYVDKYKKTADGWRFAQRAFAPSITRAPG